jgi:epsilon-lactone hydrolase
VDANSQPLNPVAIASEPFYAVTQLYLSLLWVPLQRALRGPLLPGWSLPFEIANDFAKRRTNHIFQCSGENGERIHEARARDRALFVPSPVLAHVSLRHAAEGATPGRWFEPTHPITDMLYLRGGAYAYRPWVHDHLIALIADATNCRAFVPEYRLIPEHPWPAQLDDAIAAYRGLLQTGIDPRRLVVAGESTGGHLTLALLMALRDAGIPLPACAVCLSPVTDPDGGGDSLERNSRFDFLEAYAVRRTAAWLKRDGGANHPLISPLRADSRGLPPIYIQAGGAEVLIDMIQAFVDRARAQGVDVEFDVWPTMTHIFPAYGNRLPEAEEALARIGRFVQKRLAKSLEQAIATEPVTPDYRRAASETRPYH